MICIISIAKHPRRSQRLALSAIRKGQIILFPTETVYGLGVDSKKASAIKQLYILKGRPRQKPFQYLVASAKEAQKRSSGWNPQVETLARIFWPGPLTLVVPTLRGSIGWRVPSHKWLLALLKKLGRPLVATSANLSGKKPPIAFTKALRPFNREIGLALDGGLIRGGKASTVVRVKKGGVKILREGAIPRKAVFQAVRL